MSLLWGIADSAILRFYVCNTGNLSWNVPWGILSIGVFWQYLSAPEWRGLANGVSSLLFLLHGETPQRISTTYSGRSGFRSTQGIEGTTVYRYNTFIMNFMANPMIYRGHYKFPYISLYLESSHASPQAWAACVSTTEVMLSKIRGLRRKISLACRRFRYRHCLLKVMRLRNFWLLWSTRHEF